MKSIVVHSLTFDTRDIQETEVYGTEAELCRRLLEIMKDRLQEINGNGAEWAVKCKRKWYTRLANCYNEKRQPINWKVMRTFKTFKWEEGMSALKHPEDHFIIGDHDIELPAEIQKALQSADSSLTNYHRHLWHSDRKTHGGLEREAVVKTITAIRKITRTNTPGQSL
jgi:hypothetical protein